ncbi:MAG: hypothetical protein KGO82_14360 [Bacteroidota bacterium]|nr:hypothetical protein [Bacteroidota bacterium]
MIITLLYITLATAAAAGIEAVRIKDSWGKVTNIDHVKSIAIYCALMVGVFLVHQFKIGWYTSTMFVGGALSVRLLLYAPLLNVFRGKFLEYMSSKSSSKVDSWIETFIVQRAIGAAGVVLYLLLNWLI